jgi:hypothetical protein
MNSNTSMRLSRHGEIVSVLTELYSLLDTLAAVEPQLAPQFPPPDTGVHSPTAFNADAARAAGFSAEAITVLSALPYLNVGDHEMHTELQPSTYPISYLGSDLNEDDFSCRREMLEDDLMPPSAIQLTWEEGGCGLVYIYDTKTSTVQKSKSTFGSTRANDTTGLVTPWKHWGDPTDNSNYFHVPAVSPREVFQPLINKFRSLEYLGTPPFMEFNDDLFLECGRTPPEDWENRAKIQFQADYDVWQAKRKLADIYLECGWDVNVAEQSVFRRAEFIIRREKYWRDVVKPLEQEASRIGSDISDRVVP